MWIVKDYIQKVGHFIQNNMFTIWNESHNLISKIMQVFKHFSNSYGIFIHFKVSSMLKRLLYDKIFFHIIKYSLDMARYIPRIFYLCGSKYLKKILLCSYAHQSCWNFHELASLLTFTLKDSKPKNQIKILANFRTQNTR
jgi:hypothetical protein